MVNEVFVKKCERAIKFYLEEIKEKVYSSKNHKETKETIIKFLEEVISNLKSIDSLVKTGNERGVWYIFRVTQELILYLKYFLSDKKMFERRILYYEYSDILNEIEISYIYIKELEKNSDFSEIQDEKNRIKLQNIISESKDKIEKQNKKLEKDKFNEINELIENKENKEKLKREIKNNFYRFANNDDENINSRDILFKNLSFGDEIEYKLYKLFSKKIHGNLLQINDFNIKIVDNILLQDMKSIYLKVIDFYFDDAIKDEKLEKLKDYL